VNRIKKSGSVVVEILKSDKINPVACISDHFSQLT
jgi:hypothetical protein